MIWDVYFKIYPYILAAFVSLTIVFFIIAIIELLKAMKGENK